MDTVLLSGLLGILGGIVAGLVVSILSQRKNAAEIQHLEAETRKINIELENIQNSGYRELLSAILEHLQFAVGKVAHLARPWREKPILSGKPDEEITDYLTELSFTKYEIKNILKAPDRDVYFDGVVSWREYEAAYKAAQNFHNYLISKKLLVDNKELLDACFELDVLLTEVLNITRLNITKIAPGNLVQAYSKYNNSIGPLIVKIEALIKPDLNSRTIKSSHG